MKNTLIYAALALVVLLPSGFVRHYVYLYESGIDPSPLSSLTAPSVFTRENGVVRVQYWPEDLLGPQPTEAQLPSEEYAAAAYAEIKSSAAQAAKPLAQKQYENSFFDLIDTLLTLTGDPQDPTPKLGFPELQGLINQIQSTDPTTAVNLSLNLLTIDAALKRYSTMWWDDAVRHDLGE